MIRKEHSLSFFPKKIIISETNNFAKRAVSKYYSLIVDFKNVDKFVFFLNLSNQKLSFEQQDF